MRFAEQLHPDSRIVFYLLDPFDLNQFEVLTKDLINLFGGKIKATSIPESEILTVEFGAAKIYVKFDFSYGIEIECTSLTVNQIKGLRCLLEKR